MIRLTTAGLVVLLGSVLTGCTATEPQTPPVSTETSTVTPGPEKQEDLSEQQKNAATVEVEWKGADFTAQGTYTAAQVSEAADTLESYVYSGFANPDFLTGDWTADPTGTRIAEELEDEFTQPRLEFIKTLDPESADPNVLNDVNSVVFLLRPEGEAVAWKQPDTPAVVKASGLTFSEETVTKTLKASFTVTIDVPVQTEDAKGQSVTTYVINAWLVDNSGSMKIDGYSNAWKTTPYTG